ncbi:GNAT family N-acetyltransferase [Nocardiopsis sp. N85]|uniref:GNAT family N-acetyltransferase n=1 Tax=Nocardiopsis sp. N85 TaxID=3029400 RepID=UPI00237FCED7|nr:GNAT family N-acetyltransferase [Nocardiopsis sp. N85]MDE3724388.1 GNAT family N-acetyltransferase [Nocardiopsis sp. N85]
MKIRPGGPDDLSTVLGMLDSAVEWLVSHGRTGQWGTESWSSRPKAVARVEKLLTDSEPWVAELDGEPVGALVLDTAPGPGIPPVDEPEVYVRLLVTDRRFAGHGVGAALLAHAAEEVRRRNVDLLRVDCFAGNEGRLVAYYTRQGFTPTETFTVGDWHGQVLARRVG